ncbi:hypothetical protein GCK32_019648, partial [Trichostrongylus colubriformis]
GIMDQYQRLLLCEGRQGERPEQNRRAEMARFVDEEAERIMADLENESWYHGALPFEDVICLITESGDFLLRSLEAQGGRGPVVGRLL